MKGVNNMIKRFIVIMCAMTALLDGCGRDVKTDAKTTDYVTESYTTVESLQDAVYKMLDNVTLFNNKVTFPSSFNDFDDNYTAANPIPYENYDMSMYTLYYKDKNIGFIDLSKDDDIRGLYIDDDVSNIDFNICGIGYDSSKDDVINAFGEPSEQDGTSYIYGNSESVCINFGFNGEKIRTIKIFY